MAGSQIERALSLLESLTQEPQGLQMQSLADALNIPKSATHRMLAELIRLGYVRQNPDNSRYQLSTKLVALSFRYLSNAGSDVVQSILDRLAEECGELVRLGVIDGDRLTWISKAQGAKGGLRYDPDMGRDAPLFYTASGHAWLASMDDASALALVEQQGPVLDPQQLGPNAPRDAADLLGYLQRARQLGYAWVEQSSAIGTSALAAVVLSPDHGRCIGVLSIAGPSARLDEPRIQALAQQLLAAAQELSATSPASEFFP
ncbi:IclR family transcriptional regulator [Pseudomonas sp. NPDC078700]|uniref:IclR family transcriptional regulator n=1 Tax=Pseudomonas sp. NPDC078700 TaxID=3364424 RepID=UPI0037CB85D5